jgi:hypothetical protein
MYYIESLWFDQQTSPSHQLRVYKDSSKLLALANGTLIEWWQWLNMRVVPNINASEVMDMSIAYHAAALLNNGTVKIWGPSNDDPLPQIPDTGGVAIVGINLGGHTTMVLLANGSIRSIGDHTIESDDGWMQPGPFGFVQAAANPGGSNHAGIRADGTLGYYNGCWPGSCAGSVSSDPCKGQTCTKFGTTCTVNFDGLAGCACKLGYETVRGECVLSDPCIAGTFTCSNPKTVCVKTSRGNAECRCRLGYGGNKVGSCLQPGPNGPVTQVAAGNQASAGVMADGTVVTFGANGPDTSLLRKVNVFGLNGVSAVAGLSYGWLRFKNGQTNLEPFYRLLFPSAVKEIAFSWNRAYVLLKDGVAHMLNGDASISEALDGTVWAGKKAVNIFGFGNDCVGLVFEDGTAVIYDAQARKLAEPSKWRFGCGSVAKKLEGLKTIKQASFAHDWHAAVGWNTLGVVLFNNGTVEGFGENLRGQTSYPKGLKGVVQVSMGKTHSVLLLANGTALVFGDEDVAPPYPQPGRRFTQVQAGDDHTVGLARDGTMWAWGRNNGGQLSVPGSY